ncbi:hypothetical protein [Erythrobacter sp.]|uniref:hypothetical protein n=1 Tax=Erythrobacter sp. TaxID=1042 RepID=UPI00262BDDF4|nr:hypothetical protein [Erythrobacter sp.]
MFGPGALLRTNGGNPKVVRSDYSLASAPDRATGQVLVEIDGERGLTGGCTASA